MDKLRQLYDRRAVVYNLGTGEDIDIVSNTNEGLLAGGDELINSTPMPNPCNAFTRVSLRFTNEALPIFSKNSYGSVLEKIYKERLRQDAKWGGPEHDDSHEIGMWLELIKERVDSIHQEYATSAQRPDDVTKLLIEVAAIAAAVVESIERTRA